MQLQVSVDYAVRILRYLHLCKGEVQVAKEIAESVDMTYPFFNKVAGQLRRKGLLDTIQGRNGGYVLGRPAHEISIYDIQVSLVGEPQLHCCLKNGKRCAYGEKNACKTHTFLQTLQGKMVEELSGRTIADLT